MCVWQDGFTNVTTDLDLSKLKQKKQFGQTELPDHDSIFKSESLPLI